MWSRVFLSAGIFSGAVVACLALAGIWWAIFVATGGGDPKWTPANASTVGIIGTLVYPACWYCFIYRYRDYSVRQTFLLIAGAYGVSCAVVIVVIFIGMLYRALEVVALAPSQPLVWLWLAGPFIAVIFASIAAGLIGIAYAIVATPIAFLHRLALLRIFAPEVRP